MYFIRVEHDNGNTDHFYFEHVDEAFANAGEISRNGTTVSVWRIGNHADHRVTTFGTSRIAVTYETAQGWETEAFEDLKAAWDRYESVILFPGLLYAEITQDGSVLHNCEDSIVGTAR